jgi:hypothetical protein
MAETCHYSDVGDESRNLREQIEQLVADALQADLEHVDAMAAARKLHAADLLALADVADLDAKKLRDSLVEADSSRTRWPREM